MAAGGQGKGPRFETKRRARILANEEKDLYLLFSVDERIDLETLGRTADFFVLLNFTIPLCSCREHPAFFITFLYIFLYDRVMLKLVVGEKITAHRDN